MERVDLIEAGFLMTINEDTGEEVVCPVCDATEFWGCGHLVASFDRSFCECQGGLFYDHMHKFSSLIEGAFQSHLQKGSEPSLNYDALPELWEEAKNNFEPGDEDYVDLDGDILQRFLIELLEEAGAFDAPGSLMDPGGPGMTSSMSLLFSDNPSEVIRKAARQLKIEMKEEQGKSQP